MAIISAYGTGKSSFAKAFQDAEDAFETKRTAQAARYRKWKKEALDDGVTLTAKDFHQERTNITYGDNMMSSFLGDRATDDASAARHAVKIRMQVLAEAGVISGEQKTQAANMRDQIKSNDKDFDKYLERVHGMAHPAGKVPYVKGTQTPEVQSILNTTSMNAGEWEKVRQKKRNAEIQEAMGTEHFQNNIASVDDISNVYDGKNAWFITGMKKAYVSMAKVKAHKTGVDALSAILSQKIPDLDKMDDDSLKNLVERKLEVLFLGQIMPTGKAWTDMVDGVVKHLQARKKNLKLTITATSQALFAEKWKSAPEVIKMLAPGADISSQMDLADLQSMAVGIATDAGFPVGYFDFVEKHDESMDRLQEMIGDTAFKRLQKFIVYKKDAALDAIRAMKGSQEADEERKNYIQIIVSAVAQRQDGDDAQKGAWGEAGAATLAAQFITTEYYIPPAELPAAMDAIEKEAIKTKNATAVKIAILAKFPTWKKWGVRKTQIENQYRRAFVLSPNALPLVQTKKLWEHIENQLDQMVKRIKAAPETDYQDGVGWTVTSNIDIGVMVTDWNAAMKDRKARLDNTFGDTMKDSMWTVPKAGLGFIPDDDFWTGATINTIQQLYQYQLLKLEKIKEDGLREIRGTRPQDTKVIDRGRKLKIINVTPKQRATLTAISLPASAHLATQLGISHGGTLRTPDAAKGLQIGQFLIPNATAKTKYSIPPEWLKDGVLGDDIVNNDKIKELAKEVHNLELRPKEAKKLLRNMILFGGRDQQDGKLANKISNNIFFRQFGGNQGTSYSFKRERLPNQGYLADILKGNNGLYQMPMDVLMLGEDEFYERLLNLGRIEAAKPPPTTP